MGKNHASQYANFGSLHTLRTKVLPLIFQVNPKGSQDFLKGGIMLRRYEILFWIALIIL